MKPPTWSPLLVCSLSFAVLAPLYAQSARRPTPANVLAGTLTSIDVQAGTLAVSPRTGPPRQFRLTDKTRVLKAKKPVSPADLASGESVVVRFRKAAIGPPTLYDLCDRVSWEWLDRLRHEATRVLVKEVADGELKVTEGPDNAEMAYRVTDKTQWSRGGKAVSSADVKAGETVVVSPRMLPSGSIMAAVVADTVADAALLKERTRPTVTGVVRSVDATKKTLSILSVAGDERSFTLAPDVLVRRSSKDVPVSAIRVGATVTVHVRRSLDEADVAHRVTIQTKRIAAPKAASKKPG